MSKMKILLPAARDTLKALQFAVNDELQDLQQQQEEFEEWDSSSGEAEPEELDEELMGALQEADDAVHALTNALDDLQSIIGGQ